MKSENSTRSDEAKKRAQEAMRRYNIGLDEKTAARLEELIALGQEKPKATMEVGHVQSIRFIKTQ